MSTVSLHFDISKPEGLKLFNQCLRLVLNDRPEVRDAINKKLSVRLIRRSSKSIKIISWICRQAAPWTMDDLVKGLGIEFNIARSSMAPLKRVQQNLKWYFFTKTSSGPNQYTTDQDKAKYIIALGV